MMEQYLSRFPGPDSRACLVCQATGRVSAMRADLRHLHELSPGTSFHLLEVPGEWLLEELRGEGAGVVVPSGGGTPRLTRTFTTSEGQRVAFRAGALSGRRSCAGSTEVLVLPPPGERDGLLDVATSTPRPTPSPRLLQALALLREIQAAPGTPRALALRAGELLSRVHDLLYPVI